MCRRLRWRRTSTTEAPAPSLLLPLLLLNFRHGTATAQTATLLPRLLLRVQHQVIVVRPTRRKKLRSRLYMCTTSIQCHSSTLVINYFTLATTPIQTSKIHTHHSLTCWAPKCGAGPLKVAGPK